MKLARPTGLWRHGDFLKLWSAETISRFGSEVTALGLPLAAILVLHASAFEVAALGVVEFAPFLLISLPAGVWVDRLRRRPILIAADLGRAALLASIPIAYAFDALTIWQLYVVAAAVGVCTVFFDVAYQAYLPSLVERKQLVEGNAKLEISRAGSQLGGPGLAGVLVGWLTAPVAILVDAVSFLGSAFCLFGIRKAERSVEQPPEGRARMRDDLREGIAYVLTHPYLRYIAASTATFNFFSSVISAIVIYYAVKELGLSAALIGLVFTVSNIGPLIGAFLATRVWRRFGVGPTIVASTVIGGPMAISIPLAPHNHAAAVGVIGAAYAVGGLANVVYNVTQVSLRQAMAPERIQGRMNAVMRFLVWGTIPLGQLVGGALATWIGLRATLWVGALGSCLPFLPVLLSPVRSLRDMPEEDEEELPTEPLIADAAATTAARPAS